MKDPEMEKLLVIYKDLAAWARRNGVNMEEGLVLLKTIWLNNTKQLTLPKKGVTL